MTPSLVEALDRKLVMFVELREYDRNGKLRVVFEEVKVSTDDLRNLGIDDGANELEARVR